MVLPRGGQWLQLLTASCSQHRATVQGEGHIGTQLRRDLLQLRIVQPVQRRHDTQHGGGIGGPARHAAGHRNTLIDVHIQRLRHPRKLSGLPHQVAAIGGHFVRVGTGYRERRDPCSPLTNTHAHAVGQRQRLKHRGQLVIPVRSRIPHAQVQVHLPMRHGLVPQLRS